MAIRSTPPPIKVSDPYALYLAHKAEIDDAIARVVGSGWYIDGDEGRSFEENLAAYLGVPFVVGVGNGTDALRLALSACGVGPGDGVITVSHTAVATVAAIELAGAVPVLVDIDPDSFTMLPEAVEAAVAGAGVVVRAVVPVHLYGRAADMSSIAAVARRHDLLLVEDCAQSVGGAFESRPTGAWGDAAAFSFYPTKNLGALGDGGAVATRDPEVADRVRALRQYGWRERHVSHVPGANSRLDEIQAAILSAKLPHLDVENEERQRIAARYDAGLGGTGVVTPAGQPGHVYHQYVVRTPDRDDLRRHLASLSIATDVHYPVPVHRQPAYLGRVEVGSTLGATERACAEIVSLPMHPRLGDDETRRVIDGIVDWWRGRESRGAGWH